MFEEYRKIFNFAGKNAVVAGGAGLLGSEIAKCLAAFYARVIVADVSESRGSELVSKIRSMGGQADFFHWDMTALVEIPKWVAHIDDNFGPVDVWVNSAYPRTEDWMRKLEDVTVEGWRLNVDAHLGGYCISSSEIAKRMAKRGGGSIVNVGSIHCHVAPDFRVYEGSEMTSPAAYSAIKGGVRMYSKYLASYFGRQNVRVNMVNPGGIFNHQPEVFVERYSSRTCLGRLAQTREIAAAVLFVASEGASYLTGADLVVDGGLTAI